MPTVPIIDRTATSPAQFSAPSVAPVRNAAPQQLDALGQTLQQVGGAATQIGNTIGDRLAGQVDDATVKAAETAALTTVQGVLRDPQNGYMYQQGKNAVDQYEPAKQAVSKAFQNQLDGLSNPLQKQMFQRVAQQHLLSAGQQMADHNHSQTVAWSTGESKARADNYSLLAVQASASRYQVDVHGGPVGDFAKFTAQMDGEVLNSAKLAGFDPDSAQAKAMLREQHTSMNTAIIANLLDNHDAYGAKKWFDEQSAAGNIDLRNQTALGNAVKGEYDRQQTINLADRALAASLSGGKVPTTLTMPVTGSSINVTAGLGEPRSGGRSHDGIDIAVPVGTTVMAPAAGKVIKVWNDDKFGGGMSVEMQLPNGYTVGMAHLSAANVHVGDEVQQGSQLGLSGKTGNATGPTLHYMMKDDKGKYVDPRQVSQPQPNREGIAEPDALEAARAFIEKSDFAPEIKRAAIAQVQTQHAQYRAMQNQRESDLFKKASDAFYIGGMNTNRIPPSLFSQLTPEQQQKFKDEQINKVLSDYSHSQQFKEMNEVDIRSQFMQNPDQLTPANVDLARPRLSNSTYLSLMNQATAQEKNPKGVVEAQGITDLIKYYGSHAGINVNPNRLQPAAQQTLVDLRARIDQSLNQIKAQNNGKVTQDQAEKVIKQEIIQHTITTKRSPWTAWIPGLSPTTQEKLPLGAVSTGRGSDGKQHYLDRNGQDLGVVED